MAKYQGVKEKIHSPIYDCFYVPGAKGTEEKAKTFGEVMTDPGKLNFFVDVQNKTKLETNMQAAGVLPSLNTFEVRTLRVVISSPTFRGEGGTEPPILADLIYDSVTSLTVGNKLAIEAPTWFFPSGAGVYPGFRDVANHGSPDPSATFRLAEPIPIDESQNFHATIEFPRGLSSRLQEVTGPFRIWVALDGYRTRDVQ